jgi:hypothetical protein
VDIADQLLTCHSIRGQTVKLRRLPASGLASAALCNQVPYFVTTGIVGRPARLPKPQCQPEQRRAAEHLVRHYHHRSICAGDATSAAGKTRVASCPCGTYSSLLPLGMIRLPVDDERRATQGPVPMFHSSYRCSTSVHSACVLESSPNTMQLRMRAEAKKTGSTVPRALLSL